MFYPLPDTLSETRGTDGLRRRSQAERLGVLDRAASLGPVRGQQVDHPRLGRHRKRAYDAMVLPPLKAEAGVVVRVPDHDDEREVPRG